MMNTPRRVIVALTGASGSAYGVRLLQHLRALDNIETHLLMSAAALMDLHHELGLKRADVEALATRSYAAHDVGAAIASGSFHCDAMVVAPCSMRTLAAIAHGLADNLITRAADVCLKERRRLLLLPREAPLHLTHLRNMETLTLMGAIIFPPVPALYLKPKSIEEMIDHTLARVLDLIQIEHQIAPRWAGLKPQSTSA